MECYPLKIAERLTNNIRDFIIEKLQERVADKLGRLVLESIKEGSFNEPPD